MPSSGYRLGLILSLIMLLSPTASAGVSYWAGPSVININSNTNSATAFELPGNSTILESWIQVDTNSMGTSSDIGISWEESDFDSGLMLGTTLNNEGFLQLQDDGTRSNISDFDEGEISVSFASGYSFSPGWRLVYTQSTFTNLSSCETGKGTIVRYGHDESFDQLLQGDEVTETIIYCETLTFEDTVTSLSIDNSGSGYSPGNLSASGGGGSNFSGSYSISSGIESITILDGGSGYSLNDTITAVCQPQCNATGTEAELSISSVDINGSIKNISVNNPGSGYVIGDSIQFLISHSSGSSSATLSANLQPTGRIHSTQITNSGTDYTSIPDIIISDSNGSGAVINATLGAYFDYEIDFDPIPKGAECQYGGKLLKSGLDYDMDRYLDSDEITENISLCNNAKIWSPTTFRGLNGTIYGDELTLSHGIIPSSAAQGRVSAGTLPGEPVPRGTDSFIVIPSVPIPDNRYISQYYMNFDHWYHLDTTINGGGDGAWLEYRLSTDNVWADWTYVENNSFNSGEYTNTISADAPVPNGASTSFSVFADLDHSGWVESNVSLTELSGIYSADRIQFRFHIWTHTNATIERPGWFIDDINFNNDGVNLGVWHHGCYAPSVSSCTYLPNAYGVLQRGIDFSGTNSASKIELDMEWDLQGGNYDNACIELSSNGNTWADISSATDATINLCSSRIDPIPGNGYEDKFGTEYGDQSGDFRTISLGIPNSFLGLSSAFIRIVVDTSSQQNYGGNFIDNREGLSISEIRVVDNNGNNLFLDSFDNSSSMTHFGINSGADDWNFITLDRGRQTNFRNFEDSTANSPTVSNAEGWTRQTKMNSVAQCGSDRCKFTLNKMSQDSGPDTSSSFPYAYGIAFSGNYDSYIDEAKLISPWYDIPLNGTSYFTFDHWSCAENARDGGAVFIKTSSGNWQHFNPGNWYTSTAINTAGHELAGKATFATNHCNYGGSSWTSNSAMTNLQANLDNFKGQQVKFKFSFGSNSGYTAGGWFIDNAGVKINNFSSDGTWMSDLVSLDDPYCENFQSLNCNFNRGFIDIDAEVNDLGWIRASLIDGEQVIPGFSNVTFPISLAGISSDFKILIHMGTDNPELTPLLKKIYIGGKRILNADTGYNSWSFSPGVEVVDDLLNATIFTGTITSPFTYSTRPINSISLAGNFSVHISVSILDRFGNPIGNPIQRGESITFQSPLTGFGVSVNLPTNGWIDRLIISSRFAQPLKGPTIDLLGDGNDWEFPPSDGELSDCYGNFGWQSTLCMKTSLDSGEKTGKISQIIYVDGTNHNISVRIPNNSSVNSGIIAISPTGGTNLDFGGGDSDGFESPVIVSVAGSTRTGGSGESIFISPLSQGQISAINLLNPSHTDATGREWIDIPLEFSSSTPQTITVTSMVISYDLIEIISGLGPIIADYHSNLAQDYPPPEEIGIPVFVNSLISDPTTTSQGAISLSGSVNFDYMFINRDFSVPSTLYPNGEKYEIVTNHRHLIDNEMIADITLKGYSSDGTSISFKVHRNLGSWNTDYSFSDVSAISQISLDPDSSFVELITNGDGLEDVSVHWNFDITWLWDDVDNILWEASANNDDGETIWSATSISGGSGSNAVENDLQIDSFKVLDNQGRDISNTRDTLFYPYPIINGSDLTISGTVRFQDSVDERPMMSDFEVGVNSSGQIIALQSGENGTFSGTIKAPNNTSEIHLSPQLLSVGEIGMSNGAQDSTGLATIVTVEVDDNPPIAGPILIDSPIGLQPADGNIISPTSLFSPLITITEDEARGGNITLKFWRESIDDLNQDGYADEDEYQSQVKLLSSGLTGEQQVRFSGIDVSTMDNEIIHLYVEGTDWAGLSYLQGGTGGSYGIENSWASIVVAEDEASSFAGAILGSGQSSNSAFDLDRISNDDGEHYLLPGRTHFFKVRIDEPNGFNTIDNISVMLCGYGTDLGLISFSPFTSEMWTPNGSMLEPISAETTKITNRITELELGFKLSWDFPFDSSSFNCNPRVSLVDNLHSIESSVLSSLSWRLDNFLIAKPNAMEDLTIPYGEKTSNSIYLGQGDDFSITGSVHHFGTNEVLSEIPPAMYLEATFTYGGTEIISSTNILQNATFIATVSLPPRPPLLSEMPIKLSLFDSPGLSYSLENSEYSIIVDTISPSAVFNPDQYPESSLQVIDSNDLDSIPVTVTIIENLGMKDGPLQVAWELERNNQPVQDTKTFTELNLVSVADGKLIYSDNLDFSSIESTFIEGDKISFWIISTDKSGNEINTLGGPENPRNPSIRIVEFLGAYTREVVEPSKDLALGDSARIVTYWENPGKLAGSIQVGLYEQLSDGSWRPSSTTLENGDSTVYLPPGSSSIKLQFQYQTWTIGQPILVLVINEDFENSNLQNIEIPGFTVVEASANTGSDYTTIWVLGGIILLVSLMAAAVYVIQNRSEDYYYDEDNSEVADSTIENSQNELIEEYVRQLIQQGYDESFARQTAQDYYSDN